MLPLVDTDFAAEVVPVYDEWYAAGAVPRDFYYKLGELGIFGIEVAEEYGGAGIESYKFQAVLSEETNRAAVAFGASGAHVTLCLPYLQAYATDEQKQRWLPGFVSGDIVTAIAMTEPGAGSDLQGIRTTATDRGDHYLLNGSKTFISNGILADLVVVVARTTPEGGSAGQSLLVVEAMKMEHVISAPHAGTVAELDAVAGGTVAMDQVLAIVVPDDDQEDPR